MHTPLKRHPALQPLSKEHHQVLLLAFKIRQGLKKDIDPERILKYCTRFFSSYLKPHFEKEEFHLIQILKNNSEIRSRLKLNHYDVIDGFEKLSASHLNLKEFEQLIVSHVRFEERVLFEEIQHQLTQENIHYLEHHLKEQEFQEHAEDVFWL